MKPMSVKKIIKIIPEKIEGIDPEYYIGLRSIVLDLKIANKTPGLIHQKDSLCKSFTALLSVARGEYVRKADVINILNDAVSCTSYDVAADALTVAIDDIDALPSTEGE